MIKSVELSPAEKKEIEQFYQTEIGGIYLADIHNLIQFILSNYELKYIGWVCTGATKEKNSGKKLISSKNLFIPVKSQKQHK